MLALHFRFRASYPTGTCIDSENGGDCEGLHCKLGLVIPFLEIREGTMRENNTWGPSNSLLDRNQNDGIGPVFGVDLPATYRCY